MVSYPFVLCQLAGVVGTEPATGTPSSRPGRLGRRGPAADALGRTVQQQQSGKGLRCRPCLVWASKSGGPGRLCGLTPPRVGTCTRAQTRRPAGEPQWGRARAGLGWHHRGSQSSGAGVTKTKTAPGWRPCRGLGPGQANTQTQRHRGYKTSLSLLLTRADQRPTLERRAKGHHRPLHPAGLGEPGPEHSVPDCAKKCLLCGGRGQCWGGQGGVGTLGDPSACEGRARLPQGTGDNGWGRRMVP